MNTSAAGAKRVGSREGALPPKKMCLTIVHFCAFLHVSSVRQHMISALYAIARPSVRHTGDQSKTVEVRIMKYGSASRLVFAGYVSSHADSRNFIRFLQSCALNKEGRKKEPFLVHDK